LLGRPPGRVGVDASGCWSRSPPAACRPPPSPPEPAQDRRRGRGQGDQGATPGEDHGQHSRPDTTRAMASTSIPARQPGRGQHAQPPPGPESNPASDRPDHLPQRWRQPTESETAPDRAARTSPSTSPSPTQADSEKRNLAAPVLGRTGLGLSVTSCQDDEAVIEKDGDPATTIPRVVASKLHVSAPSRLQPSK
jgi:hypothetical protein